MLFNSYPFLCVFLPLTLAGYWTLARRGTQLAMLWLAAASLLFYGWWEVRSLPLLLLSILGNYLAEQQIGRCRGKRTRLAWLAGAVAANLLLLGHYKYAGWPGPSASLPIGISFFTFTQIAWLADCHRGQAGPCKLRHYVLFVSYFPHLIAGPLLHHRDMMPQFERQRVALANSDDCAAGLSIFCLGLAKKVLLADHLAPHANLLFNSQQGTSLLLAWGGVLAYSFQLYFDFSAYSDMAVGVSRLFGIRLPQNFASPYKAGNISDFWRRWHMTLSRFLRDYLYIPLGGSRHGLVRRYASLMLTMVLGGLWHGAGWNFAIWGALHGLYLMLHHGWSALHPTRQFGVAGRVLATGLTFIAVAVAWVFFRAPDLASALRILHGLAGGYGVGLPDAVGHHIGRLMPLLEHAGWQFYLGGGERFGATWGWVLVAALIAFGLPNTQQIIDGGVGKAGLVWAARPLPAVAIGLLASASLLSLTTPTAFLYFQF